MSTMLNCFLIIGAGYLLGGIKVRGLQLGTSGVLLVALVFGHFGFEMPVIMRDLGLICFVTAVGFIAGPQFFRNLKSKVLAYVILGVVIILTGAAVCICCIKLADIPTPLCVGIMTGALTSTPGLAAALEATGDTAASIGYGIAYPFGVVGVVLFVQLVPKLIRNDKYAAKAGISAEEAQKGIPERQHYMLDSFGFFSFALAVVAGLLAASVSIPLPGGARFNLGISGGPLIAGLMAGHFRHIGKLSLYVNKKTLDTLREFGLVLFLMGAGVQAGADFVETLKQYGWALFLFGALITILPMVVGFVFSRKLFHLDVMSSLSAICGGMTSTPALGTLIEVAKNDDVAGGYAATYPVALVFVVLASQFISLLF